MKNLLLNTYKDESRQEIKIMTDRLNLLLNYINSEISSEDKTVLNEFVEEIAYNVYIETQNLLLNNK